MKPVFGTDSKFKTGLETDFNIQIGLPALSITLQLLKFN